MNHRCYAILYMLSASIMLGYGFQSFWIGCGFFFLMSKINHGMQFLLFEKDGE